MVALCVCFTKRLETDSVLFFFFHRRIPVDKTQCKALPHHVKLIQIHPQVSFNGIKMIWWNGPLTKSILPPFTRLMEFLKSNFILLAVSHMPFWYFQKILDYLIGMYFIY